MSIQSGRRGIGSSGETAIAETVVLTDSARGEIRDRTADVCIAGAGPAGIILTRELCARGVRVCLLEAGGLRPSLRGLRDLAGPHDGVPYFPLWRARARAFGGTSHYWYRPGRGWSANGGLRSRPLDAWDFDLRGWVPGSGWPFGAEALAGPYRRAAEHLELHADAFDADANVSQLAMPGVNVTWCRFAPATALRETLPELQRNELADVVLHATVVGIESAGGRVTKLRVAGGDGRAFDVRARQFVLAGGGIENARILLNAGIGNEHGQVGRNFLEHVQYDLGSFTPADPEVAAAMAGFSRHEDARGPIVAALQLEPAAQAEAEALNAVAAFLPRSARMFDPAVRSAAALVDGVLRGQGVSAPGKHVRNVLGGMPAVLGAARSRLVPGRAPSEPMFAVISTAEQAPNPASRVRLSRQRDRFGLPRAHVTWRLTDLDYRSARRTLEALSARFAGAGLGRLETAGPGREPLLEPVGCRHHIGTTRMHADSREGVVDANGRVHSMENLFVAGSSVMPTAGATTVTLTLAALAVRLADHLAGLAGAEGERQQP